MKKSKIQQLPASKVSAAVSAIEAELAKSSRPTKKQALNVLVGRDLCSPSSDKALKTFLNHAVDSNVGIPEHFAKLMGVRATAVAERPNAPAASESKPTATRSEGKGKKVEVAISLKGVSILHVKSEKAKALFPDGSVISVSGVDESAVRSSAKVLEFNAS